MKVLKYLGICALALIALFAIGVMLANRDAANRQYDLSIANSGPVPVTLSVSDAEGAWSVGAGESKTITIEKQKDEDRKKDRTFTLTYPDGHKEALQSGIGFYNNLVVLDVTGTSCLVLADYAAQYRNKEEALAEGESDIKFVRIFQGQRIFPFPHKEDGSVYYVATNLGDKLPETVKIPKGAVQPSEHLRLVNVPCPATGDPQALYDFLNKG